MNPADTNRIIPDLLSSSLFGVRSPSLSEERLRSVNWREIFSRARILGVFAIVFDSFKKLSETVRLDVDDTTLFNAAAYSKSVEAKYSELQDRLLEVNSAFGDKNIRLFTFKGFQLSSMYPVPEHREFGDVDIWEDCDYAFSEDLLHRLCNSSASEDRDHLYKGCKIENHQIFTGIKPIVTELITSRRDAKLRVNSILEDLIRSESQTITVKGKNLFAPSATFNFIYLTVHSAAHFEKVLSLRHLTDWACFLYACKGRYDLGVVDFAFEGSSCSTMAKLFTQIAVDYLGLPKEFAPEGYYGVSDSTLCDRIMQDVMNPFPPLPEGSSFSTKVLWHLKRLKAGHWKTALVSGESLFYTVLRWALWNVRRFFYKNEDKKDVLSGFLRRYSKRMGRPVNVFRY